MNSLYSEIKSIYCFVTFSLTLRPCCSNSLSVHPIKGKMSCCHSIISLWALSVSQLIRNL